MSTINERIKAIMEFKGENPNSLGVKIDTSRQAVTNIVTNVNKPSYDFIQALLELFPDISSDYVIKGEGPMVREKGGITKELSNSGNYNQANPTNKIRFGGQEPVNNLTSNFEIEFLREQIQDLRQQKALLSEKVEKLEADKSALYEKLLKILENKA